MFVSIDSNSIKRQSMKMSYTYKPSEVFLFLGFFKLSTLKNKKTTWAFCTSLPMTVGERVTSIQLEYQHINIYTSPPLYLNKLLFRTILNFQHIDVIYKNGFSVLELFVHTTKDITTLLWIKYTLRIKRNLVNLSLENT